MPTPILATKLYSPPPRPHLVLRPRLLARLNEGLQRKLTLVSAPAGFGKTTLVTAWIKQKDEDGRMKDEQFLLHPFHVAWLSLDAGDSDPSRFLAYLVAAVQMVAPQVGIGVATALQSSQPPPPETLLTALINELMTLTHPLVLVLDDYHLVDAGGPQGAIDQALAFLIEHLPPQMHLLIATREDPQLPLARLRARGQLSEVRAADLRFTAAEATEFFNRMLGLKLAPEAVTALEQRTEGWIAGLQLAALSLQGHDPQDVAGFIGSFTGSHRFIMDYLVEEVLCQQSAEVQTFLLRTAILERFCAPLCDAVLGKDEGGRMKDEESHVSFRPHPSAFILDYLERANLFLIPLDNERRWYRYHHLFADLLRQRLHQSVGAAPAKGGGVAEYHIRASIWYEANGLEIDAFYHAVAANDSARAARLVEGNGMPLHFRGAQMPVLKWLESLPPAVLDAHPALWVIYASVLLFAGKNSHIEQKLQAAEAVLAHAEADQVAEAKRRDLIGHIASIRAFLAIAQNQVDEIAAQSQRSLDHLHPDNLPVRTAATWSLGYAYQLQGNFDAARQAHQQAIAISRRIGHTIIQIAASIGLGQIQEIEGQLAQAFATFQSTVQAAGDPPLLVACEAYLGLGRIFYEWNDLSAAQQAAEKGIDLAGQIELISTKAACQVLLARLKLAAGDITGATDLLVVAERFAEQNHFMDQLPGIIATKALALLRQHKTTEAAHLVQQHKLPISQAQVAIAQGKPAVALAVLEPLHQEATTTGRLTERLSLLTLQVLAYQAQGASQQARTLLHETLTLAERGGFIRLFVDHGAPMLDLLTKVKDEVMQPYLHKVLTAFGPQATTQSAGEDTPSAATLHPSSFMPHPLLDPLSERELEVLHLIAQGLSNQEIGARLFLALDTVKGHNRRIFAKLQVQRRTEAIAKARELKLLPVQ